MLKLVLKPLLKSVLRYAELEKLEKKEEAREREQGSGDSEFLASF